MELTRALSVLALVTATVAAVMAAEQLPAPELTEVWSPIPPKVAPGRIDGAPPSDAVVLFDGGGLSKWEAENGGPAKWRVEKGELVVEPHTGSIQTKETFSDCQLHLEWMSPAGVPENQTGQSRSNSGVFLQGRYEVQVLDSFTNVIYVNGQAGAVYKQFAPLVNATKPAGMWQSYDMIFTAPRFAADGSLTSPAKLTVLQNGVLIQNGVSLKGPTEFRGTPPYTAHGPAPLLPQDHNSPVRFRNIWLRRL